MKLSIEGASGAYLVRAYSEGGVRINERMHEGSVIVSASTLIEGWRPASVEDLVEDDLRPALDLRPEVLLIGTGRRQRFPRRDVLAALYATRAGFEIMDTGAACRTYNVLVGEGRRVAAALIVERT